MRRKYFMGKILAFVLALSLVVFSGCNDNNKKVQNRVEQNLNKKKSIEKSALAYLKENYNEEFIIKNTRYIKATQVYEMTAVPKSDEELEFYVKTGGYKYGNRFVSNYETDKIGIESNKYYGKLINEIFKCKHRSSAGIYPDYKFSNIPTVEEILEVASEKSYVSMRIAIFEDIINDSKRKKEFLNNVLELVYRLKKQNLKYAMIVFDFYEEDFFKGKDIDRILEVSNWFQRGTSEVDVFEYSKKKYAGIWIERKEYFEIKTIEDVESQINYRENYKRKGEK